MLPEGGRPYRAGSAGGKGVYVVPRQALPASLWRRSAEEKPLALTLLLLTIASEVARTVGLKASAVGFNRFGPSVLAVLWYAAAFYFLSVSLKQIPLGIVYAIWSGRTVSFVLLEVLLWWESLGFAHLAGIGVIVAGVVILNVFVGSPGREVSPPRPA